MPKTMSVVERDDLDRKPFSAILTVEGHETRAAADARGPLEAARGRRPDPILPERAGGLAAGAAARRRSGPAAARAASPSPSA